MKTVIYSGRRVPAPRFKLGEKVRISGLKSVGKISFNSGFDDHLGQWRYKIAFANGSRLTFNENSIRRKSARR